MRTAMQLDTTAGQKPGTARHSKGQLRVSEILTAARAVLLDEDYTQFSMRTIAGRAGIHLSNLQYYFPTREDLIQGLMQDIAAGYFENYEQLFTGIDDSATSHFDAVIDFLIDDITNQDTRRLFIQLYALLESADNSAGNLLSEMYEMHISNLNRFIKPLNPALSTGQRQQRATMIAALIEGMMLMYRDADLYKKKSEPDIKDEIKRQIHTMIYSK